MKRTIKTLFILAVLAVFSANTVHAQLGIQAGYVNSKFYSEGESSDPYNGFEVGLTYNMPVMGGFSLQYGLLYTLITDKNEISTIKTTSTGHYANIPVRAAYSYAVNNDFSIFAYAGPNFAIGLAGKEKVKGETTGLEGELKWYGDEIDFNRFDLKLGLGVGVQYNSIVLKGGYDWGLLNTIDNDDAKKNRNQFNISLGYIF